MRELPAEFVRALADALPSDLLSDDADEVVAYGRDWTRAHRPAPAGLARPRGADEVVALVRLARRFGVALVPSGGRTGLAGGAVAAAGELVVSLERMARIGEVDRLAGTIWCEAGAITERVHQRCAAAGLIWPIDLAARGSSTIGGNLATNAGGVRVIRYGHARRWLRGLEAVTATGERVVQPALEKNNSGLDLAQLYVGTEGTLGIITAATLALAPRPGRLDVLLFALDGIAPALAILGAARARGLIPAAFELWTARCAHHVRAASGLAPPLGEAAAYALLELEDAAPAALEGFAPTALALDGVRDGVLAEGEAERRALWQLRERITESLARTGPVHKNDVALPLDRLGEFVVKLEALTAARRPGWELCLFGHAGDGNLHVNTLKPPGLDADAFFAAAHAADHEVFALVQALGGSISAEHGIGLVKKPYLSYVRGPHELEVMRAVKRALDPDGIMNPGKIFDP
jgi:FAD/FMN-containing dehydrogenase